MRALPENTDAASTTAVFSAPGVTRERNVTNASSLFAGSMADDDNMTRSEVSSMVNGNGQGKTRSVKTAGAAGAGTPSSRRSVERLMNNQVVQEEEQTAEGRKLVPLRSASTVAVVRHEGIVKSVEGSATLNERSKIVDGVNGVVAGRRTGNMIPTEVNDEKRPGMYDRADSEFQTALEKFD